MPIAGPDLVRARLRAAAHAALAPDVAAPTPLLVLDRDALAARVALWRRWLPDVEAHFALKANNLRVVLEDLRDLGVGFDAATGGELDLLADLQVPATRVLCTHPIRDALDLRAVGRHRPAVLVVHDLHELHKLRAAGVPGPHYRPTLLVRVSLPFSNLNKFGSRVLVPDIGSGHATWRLDPQRVLALFAAAREIEREAGAEYGGFGLAGHVGTNCHDVDHFRLMLAVFRWLRDEAAAQGTTLAMFDLGGGYCDETAAARAGTTPAALLQALGEVVAEVRAACPDVRLVAEPGRILVADCAALVTTVKSVQRFDWRSRRSGDQQQLDHLEIHIDDGIYGSLMGQAHDDKVWDVQVLRTRAPIAPPPTTLPAQIWGATCDTYDQIEGLRPLPADLAVGEQLFIPGAGAYTLATSTRFNHAAQPRVWAFTTDADGNHRGTLCDHEGRRLGAWPSNSPSFGHPSSDR